MEHPIDKAARVMGSRAELARRLKVTKAAVGQWREPGRRVPAEHCPVIEQMTQEAGERITCEELRPDVAWSVLRNSGHRALTAHAQAPLPRAPHATPLPHAA